MKVTFKTLQQKSLLVDVDENDTIRQMKEKLEVAAGPGFPSALQKLIYGGKVLEDDKTAKDYNIDAEKGFVVVMVTRSKIQPESEASTAKPVETPSTPMAAVEKLSPSAVPAAVQGTSVSTKQSVPPKGSVRNSSPVSTAESTMAVGSTYEKTVQNIVNMGFPRDQVLLALRASFNNPDRAVDYLINGFEGAPLEQIEAQPVAEPQPQPTRPEALTGVSSSLESLRSLPQFQYMKSFIQQNPDMLEELISEIGSANPSLLMTINENYDEFLRLLNEPITESPVAAEDPARPEQETSGARIVLTVQDQGAVQRLMLLGFSEYEAVEAYIACDRNEELAANLLLNSTYEDE